MVTPGPKRLCEFFERWGCGKLRESKHNKVCSGGAVYSTDGNPLVQRHQSSLVLDRQSQEVQIRQLPRAVNVTVLELPGIQEADLIRPKFMVCCSRGVLQHTDQHRYGLRAAVTGLAHDAKTPILGQCTGGPALLNVSFKPLGRTNMVNMIPVMQCDQHIDVKQRTHQTPSASRKRSISSLLMTTPLEGKG
jgi:gamma-glutamyl-gamma-aminobutyrate hydrolase PuuD